MRESDSLALPTAVLAVLAGQTSLACKVLSLLGVQDLPVRPVPPGWVWCSAATAWDVRTLGMGREDLVLEECGVSPGRSAPSGLLMQQIQGLPCAVGRQLVAVPAAQREGETDRVFFPLPLGKEPELLVSSK